MSPGLSVRFSLRTSLLAGAAVILAGCASGTSGTGSAATSGSTPRSSATESPPASASTGDTAPCAADYCDDFSDPSSKWPAENDPRYFARYDPFLGGTYRMGERTVNAKTALAPVDTTTISANYGVQIDVDAVLGKSAPAKSFIGIVCWDHATSSGSEAGFFFFVTADSVDVTLLPDTGSQPRVLDQNTGGSFVRPYPEKNHLTATCVQAKTATGSEADLTLSVNGASVLHEQYANSLDNYPWTPGPHAGLLVAGLKSDVFYDNFAVTGV
jgi:hypothetical protein